MVVEELVLISQVCVRVYVGAGDSGGDFRVSTQLLKSSLCGGGEGVVVVLEEQVLISPSQVYRGREE